MGIKLCLLNGCEIVIGESEPLSAYPPIGKSSMIIFLGHSVRIGKLIRWRVACSQKLQLMRTSDLQLLDSIVWAFGTPDLYDIRSAHANEVDGHIHFHRPRTGL